MTAARVHTEVEKPLLRADEAFRDARGEFLPWEHPPGSTAVIRAALTLATAPHRQQPGRP